MVFVTAGGLMSYGGSVNELYRLVGVYAGGTICRGFANSLGQRNWHEVDSFNFDWSLYLEADKAVKGRYAGLDWQPFVDVGQLLAKNLKPFRSATTLLDKPEVIIDAVLPQPLVVRLLGPDSKPLPGVLVQFTSAAPYCVDRKGTTRGCAPVLNPAAGTLQTTDSAGLVRVSVRLGGKAGPQVVSVAYEPYASPRHDSTIYMVRPGAPATAWLFLADQPAYRTGVIVVGLALTRRPERWLQIVAGAGLLTVVLLEALVLRGIGSGRGGVAVHQSLSGPAKLADCTSRH